MFTVKETIKNTVMQRRAHRRVQIIANAVEKIGEAVRQEDYKTAQRILEIVTGIVKSWNKIN